MDGVMDVVIVTPAALIGLLILVLLLKQWPSADRAAEALLRELVTEGEYRQLRAAGYLDVASPTQPGRIYRVPRTCGRVLVLEGGRARERLCIQPAARDLPEADVVLMHKLLIQADEELYLSIANHFRDPLLWEIASPWGTPAGGGGSA
jgi:hypothetical protein